MTDSKAVETGEGWLDLAAIVDLSSRMVVGWARAATKEAVLPNLALGMALASREPDAGLLHHWARTSELSSEPYQGALREVGIQLSMSRTGTCWENGAMESFFATLPKEGLTRRHFRTRQEARTASFEYRECFSNPVRLHST